MTNLEKLDAYAECARRDGDEDAAKAIEGLKRRAEELERHLSDASEQGREWLRERDEWKARAEQAEKERDEARRIHAANVEAGIELAKEFNRVGGIGSEVDGVFRRSRALLALFLEHKTARERAEADNAALLEAYRRTWGCVQHDNVLHSPACNASDDELGTCTPECPALYVSSLLRSDHPGAALLEYVAALEEAWGLTRGMFEDLAENGYRADAVFTERETAARVLKTLDALKERKP